MSQLSPNDRLLIRDMESELARLLVQDVPSFKLCKACSMEAYAVKHDPRGAGVCTRSYDNQHVWYDCTDMPDTITILEGSN